MKSKTHVQNGFLATCLEEQGTVCLQPNALAIGQGQQPVVVHHGVHVLHPQGIHIAIKQDVPAATKKE